MIRTIFVNIDFMFINFAVKKTNFDLKLNSINENDFSNIKLSILEIVDMLFSKLKSGDCK